jgi:hypothetical protein
VRGVNNSARR